MKIISGFLVYRVYRTYKSHFSSSSTDISKYKFRLFNPSYETFMNVKGKNFYDVIAKKLRKEKDVTSMFISAFMEDPSLWIGSICTNLPYYNNLRSIRENRIENISYLFKQNCIYLFEEGMKFDNNMGQFILYKFLKSDIELETFIIFKKLFNFNLDKNINYDYLYRGKYEKYENLLVINTKKYKNILEDILMTFGTKNPNS